MRTWQLAVLQLELQKLWRLNDLIYIERFSENNYGWIWFRKLTQTYKFQKCHLPQMLATFKCNMEQSTTKYKTNKIWLLVYFLTLPPLPCSPLTSWTDWGIWRHIKGKSVLRTELGQPINTNIGHIIGSIKEKSSL